jgi:hypothetical protein
MGLRIEQRRKAVRKALRTLQVPESVKVPELLSRDPAFTPVDGEQGELSEPSNVTNISEVSSLSQVGSGPPSDAGAHASKGLRAVVVLLLAISAVLGYFLYETRLKAALFPRTAPQGADQEPAYETTHLPAVAPTPAVTSQPRAAGEKPPGTDQKMPTLSLDELEVEQPPRREAPPAQSQAPALPPPPPVAPAP